MLNASLKRIARPSIVFKRWSHKGYAAFVGLHRHIIIGRLQAADCYAAMLKNGQQTYRALPQTVGLLRRDEEDDVGSDIGLRAMLIALLCALTCTVAAVVPQDVCQTSYCPTT